MWITNLTSMIYLSTSESEVERENSSHYQTCTKAVIWISHMISEVLGVPESPIIIFEDNQTCIKMITNPVVSVRVLHFTIHMW